MELTFDYYKNVQDPDVILCNPDRKELGYLNAVNRHFTLRFNNLSDFTFEMPKYISHRDGAKEVHPYYDLLTTKRLVFVEKIGWFRIKEVVETENSAGVNKSVTAESHQSMFKDFGFVEENRVYKFYDELDETDSNYNANNEEHMPSVVGQLYQQLGIHCNLMNVDTEPTTDYGEWTIIWIEESLKFSSTKTENICRTLGGNTESYGYDFMVSTVEEAFQVIFEFDFLHHAIKVKTTDSVTKPTNIYLSFDNLIQELSVTENSDEVVTVLSCVGSDLDITSVNPMGTNYICDFSYFKGNEENGYPWMSKELTDALDEWETNLENNKTNWKSLVAKLQGKYLAKAPLDERKQYINLKMQDTERARDDFVVGKVTGEVTFLCENVTTDGINNTTLYVDSIWYGDYTFDPSLDFKEEFGDLIYLHEDAPKWTNDGFSFGNDAGVGASTINDAFFGSECKNLYFMEDDINNSFCKLIIREIPDQTTNTSTREVVGFERYTTQNKAGYWVNLYSSENTRLENLINDIVGNDADGTEDTIKGIDNLLKEISDECNMLSYFENNYPELLSELKCYWVDGQYSNDTLKALDETTVAENITLAQQLMEAGEVELNRVSQPRFNFSVTAANFLKIYEFVQFAREIQLGRVITVEKNETTHYYPSLTEMSFNLDTSEDFSLSFSNSLKLTDWGYTYADLIKNSSSTSRTVSSNWSNLMDYSKHKEEINDLLMHTLDRTLRAGLDNACAQEFLVDNTGILGRKINEDGTYQDKQIRLINNLILFTRDNWQTACTALGEITYTNADGEVTTSYGLATETLVGKLILGEQLYIGDESGNVKITNEGIEITANDGSVLTAKSSGISFENGIISNFGCTKEEQFSYHGEKYFSVKLNDSDFKEFDSDDGGIITTFTCKVEKTFEFSGIDTIENCFIDEISYLFDADEECFASSWRVGSITQTGNKITIVVEDIVTQGHAYEDAFRWNFSNFTLKGRIVGRVINYKVAQGAMINLSDNPWLEFADRDGENYSKSIKLSPRGLKTYEQYEQDQGNYSVIEIDGASLRFSKRDPIGDELSYGIINPSDDGILICGFGWILDCNLKTRQNTTIYLNGCVQVNYGGSLTFDSNDTYMGTIYSNDQAFFIHAEEIGKLTGWWEVEDYLKFPWVETVASTGAHMSGEIDSTGILWKWYSNNDNSASSPRTIRITGYSATFYCPEYTNASGTKQTGSKLEIIPAGGAVYLDAYSAMYLNMKNGNTGYLYGTWKTQSAITTTSDVNEKNSIETLDDRYSVLFDNLTPVRYKYNHGTSGRYHSGLLAQPVKEAIAAAGLNSNEFAAYVEISEQNEDGEKEITCGLRYEEFIALCINEIQKLKKEIKEIKGNET